MFRLSAVAVVVLAAWASGAPVPREELRPPVPLAGSVWEGEGIVSSPTLYEFHPNGRISMTYNGSRHANIGTWKQDGRAVYFETNNQYSEFEGTLAGTTLTGRAWNQPGGKWNLSIKRKTAPPAE